MGARSESRGAARHLDAGSLPPFTCSICVPVMVAGWTDSRTSRPETAAERRRPSGSVLGAEDPGRFLGMVYTQVGTRAPVCTMRVSCAPCVCMGVGILTSVCNVHTCSQMCTCMCWRVHRRVLCACVHTFMDVGVPTRVPGFQALVPGHGCPGRLSLTFGAGGFIGGPWASPSLSPSMAREWD